jgi:hypothetical protein
MIRITDDQLDRMQTGQFGQFELRCQQFLRDEFPEIEVMSTPEQEMQAIRSGIYDAQFSDCRSEQDITGFLYLRQLLGAGFELSNRNTVVSQIFQNKLLSISERIEQSFDCVAQALDSFESKTRSRVANSKAQS